MPRVLLLLAVAVAAGALAAGCGQSEAGTEPTVPTSGPGVEPGTGPTDVVVDIHSGVGAFAPLETTVDDRPVFRLYGDGTVLTREDRPGLPALSTYVLSPEGVQYVVDAADSAGLLAEPASYGEPGITDVGSTIVALEANGGRFEHAAYALGFEMDDDPLLTAAQREARVALQGFVDSVTILPRARPDLLASGPSPYEPEAVDVFAWPVEGDLGGADFAEWPLAQPLGELPAEGPVESRCLTVAGSDLRTLEQALAGQQGYVLWRSGGVVYSVGFRALLPGETGCSA